MDFSKMSKEQLLELYNKESAARQQPQQEQQPQAPQANSLQDSLSQLGAAGLLPQKPSIRTNLADMLLTFSGVKPQQVPYASNDDMGIGKAVVGEVIKKQFDDPNYVVSYDQEGKPVFTRAPGNIKNAPFYSTPTGGNYYGSKTEESKAGAKVLNNFLGQEQTGMQPQNTQNGNNNFITPEATIRGVKVVNPQQTIEAQKLEKRGQMIPTAQTDVLGDIQSTIDQVSSLKDRAATGNFKTGPMSVRFTPNDIPFGRRYAAQVSSPEESQFASDLTAVGATYAKAESGAARGFKEIEYLATAMPTGILPPDQFIAVAESAIGRQIVNMENAVNSLRQSGYDVTEYDNRLNEYKQKYSDLINSANSQRQSVNTNQFDPQEEALYQEWKRSQGQ